MMIALIVVNLLVAGLGAIVPSFREIASQSSIASMIGSLLAISFLVYRITKVEAKKPQSPRTGHLIQHQSNQDKQESRHVVAIRQLKAQQRQLLKDNESLSNEKRNLLISKFALSTCILFCISHFFGVIIRDWAQLPYKGTGLMTTLSEPKRFLVLFAESETLLISAILLGAFQVRRLARQLGRVHILDCFKVVYVCIAIAGVVWLFQLTPEYLNSLYSATHLEFLA